MIHVYGMPVSVGLAILFSLFLSALFLISLVPFLKDPKNLIGDKIVRTIPLLIYVVFIVFVFILFLNREG